MMLEPAVPYQAERRCLRGTNVLETTFCTSGGAVHVVDALNRDEDGPLPWTELARDVRGLLRLRDQEIAVVTGQAGKSRARRAEVGGEFTARPGADALLALAAADWGPYRCRARTGYGCGCAPRRRPGSAGRRRWSLVRCWPGSPEPLRRQSARSRSCAAEPEFTSCYEQNSGFGPFICRAARYWLRDLA